jgi:hypothetical protein
MRRVPPTAERPRRLRRSLLAILIMACLVTISSVAVAMFMRPAPVPLPVSTPPPHGPRIVYPAGRYPVLTLPDGERREVRSLLNVDRQLAFGDVVWNDAGVPAGPLWIRVDLALQTLSVFRAGHEIGSTLILYGADSKPTPPGVYPILERAVQHRSSLYDAEMPYMLRLTPDGVAIHASAVRASAATHGCIGVPLAFARLLFAQARRGDRVAIMGPAKTAPAHY